MNVLFVIPGDINLPTGGYRYNREIIEHLKPLGFNVQLLSLEGNFPFPSEKEKNTALQKIDELAPSDIAIVDGLAGGAMPHFIEKLSQKMPLIALIHHPLCLESGLDEASVKDLQQEEHNGLKFVSKIITTSEKTAQSVVEIFNQPPEKLDAILPGVSDIGISKNSGDDKIKLLCVASVIKRKNHVGLLNALSELTTLNWHLDCIGMTDADKKLFAKLQTQIKETGLEDRVTFHGALEAKALNTFYLNADIFVLPSLYEGYGMVFAEAIMCGLPIITSNAGAIPDTVPQSCGILVEPDENVALRNALKIMISNTEIRQTYQQACLEAKSSLPSWPQSAQKLANILKGMK